MNNCLIYSSRYDFEKRKNFNSLHKYFQKIGLKTATIRLCEFLGSSYYIVTLQSDTSRSFRCSGLKVKLIKQGINKA